MSETKPAEPAAQEAEAKRAMKLKAEAADAPHPDPGQTANSGMNPTPNSTIAPSGALNAEGQRPVLERSHKVR
ncbi:MAG: hypothetical protein GC145_13925 [Caulobacter sp.]|nr:hypothetical protein [Caulobacter sp.]